MYEVIHFFTDLQDSSYPYNVGDEFPRHGMVASKERFAELSGSENKQGVPLIKEIKDVVENKSYKKSEIMTMKKNGLITLAAESGIENAAEMNVAELKEKLIDILIG